MSPIKVLLVHEYELARLGLRRMLEAHDDIEVVGEAADGTDALMRVATLSPDVIVMAADLPTLSGLETVALLKRRGLAGAVIVLSSDDARLAEAMQVGAKGYVVQDAEADELASAIRGVPEGGFVFGATLMKTAGGREVALRYFAGHEATRQATPAPAPVAATAAAQAPAPAASEPESPGDLATEAQLVLSPPLEPTQLLKLHHWLAGAAGGEIRKTEGMWQGDTVVEVSFRQPIVLKERLAALPFVREVREEPYAGNPLAGLVATERRTQRIGVGRFLPKRLRLTLKSEP
ncbi:MAG: response regulator transcription factor [Chloroflexi bacterium]|nr:response regulator transcription factor [Chloroflexota bacterium]